MVLGHDIMRSGKRTQNNSFNHRPTHAVITTNILDPNAGPKHFNTTMGSMPPVKKRILLNFFEYACTGSHMSPGQWRDPSDRSHTKDRLEYWTNLAKLAERGKISYIFLADSYGGQEVFAGNSDAQLKAGNQTASMDPMVLIAAMAAVTETLGFGVSASTSYLNPYILARTFSSLITSPMVEWRGTLSQLGQRVQPSPSALTMSSLTMRGMLLLMSTWISATSSGNQLGPMIV